MIIRSLKLKPSVTRNTYQKELSKIIKAKPSSKTSFQPTFQTFLRETVNNTNSKPSSFAFLTSNKNTFEQNSRKDISFHPIHEERQLCLLNNTKVDLLKERTILSSAHSRLLHIAHRNEDSLFSRHKSNSGITRRLTLLFPKKILSSHDSTHSHDVNLFNKRYLHQDPNENYVRNSFRLKNMVLSRIFVEKIKQDLTALKFNNKIKVISPYV